MCNTWQEFPSDVCRGRFGNSLITQISCNVSKIWGGSSSAALMFWVVCCFHSSTLHCLYGALFLFLGSYFSAKENQSCHQQPLPPTQSAVRAVERWHGRGARVTAITKHIKRRVVITAQQFWMAYFPRLSKRILIPRQKSFHLLLYTYRSELIVQAGCSVCHLPTETVCKWLTLPPSASLGSSY